MNCAHVMIFSCQNISIEQSIEHLAVDKASHIFKHLQNSERCRSLCSIDCFHILDHATTSFQLKIKEAIHIQKELPCLNQQLHHVNLKLSF